MYDETATIADFLAATSARQPTPGGGSVAALAGALAAAIGEMVLNYSVGKKDLAAHEPELRRAAVELVRAREVLLRLMVEDQAAYAELTAARKQPGGEPGRPEALTAALWACVRAPQATAATAVAILGLCDGVVDHVNRFLLSDLAVAADLAMATVRAASYNVRVNLDSFESPDDRHRLQSQTDELVAHALTLVQRVSPRIWSRPSA